MIEPRSDAMRAIFAALPIAIIVVVVAIAGEPVREALQWHRASIAEGEWWRLLTAHLVHLDLMHASVNAAVLVLLAVLFGHVYSLSRHAVNALVGMLVIDAGLYMLGDLDWYVGLSGVLHAMAAAAVVRLIITRGDPLAWGVAVFGFAKIVYENLAGAMPFTAQGTLVVTDAHLLGVLAGMAVGLIPGSTRDADRLNDRA